MSTPTDTPRTLETELAAAKAEFERLANPCGWPHCEPAKADATELTRLRALFPAILAALRNGGCCTTDVSVEFLECVPNEVASVVSRLRAENDEMRVQIEANKRKGGGCQCADDEACAHVRRAEKAEERLKWLERFLQAGGSSINTVSYYTVENHPDDTDETHFNFPFQIGISVETENRGCYEWVEFSNGAKGLCPAIDAAKIKYAEWQNKMHKGANQ
jgi:hypothetical protein